MGSTSQTGRERKMSLLVLLLISSAFGRPSSDVEADITEKVKQLEYILHFNNETRNLLNSSRLLGSVSNDLRAAEMNILEMETELNNLRELVPALTNETNYFPEFNEAKFYLRQTRQELRELAERTLGEVKGLTFLLNALDISPNITILKLALAGMKDLMIKTLKILKVANEKYRKAEETFDNLVSSVEEQKDIMNAALIALKEQFLKDEASTKKKILDCQIAAVFTLGLCPLINHYVNVVPLGQSREKLADLESKTDSVLTRTKTLKLDIDEAIIVLSEEIDQINIWAISAEVVNNNIDIYPAEYLAKMKLMRDVFFNGLVDLKDVAENYLHLTQ